MRKKHSDFANYHIEVQKYGQEMEEFAYTAAHDLRSPLRAVNSFLKLIESKCTWATDDKEKMYFKFIIYLPQMYFKFMIYQIFIN